MDETILAQKIQAHRQPHVKKTKDTHVPGPGGKKTLIYLTSKIIKEGNHLFVKTILSGLTCGKTCLSNDRMSFIISSVLPVNKAL